MWKKLENKNLVKNLLGAWNEVPDLKVEYHDKGRYAVFCDLDRNPKTWKECRIMNHTYKGEEIETSIDANGREVVPTTFPEVSNGYLTCNNCDDKYDP